MTILILNADKKMKHKMEKPYFGDDVRGYLEWLHENDPKTFKSVVLLMIFGPSTDSGGTCTSQNCFGTTGCHKTTTNGSCQCIDANTCSWVPAT